DGPLHPLIARLEREAGFNHSDTAAERLAKLEAVLAPTAPPPDDIGLLAALLSIPTDGRYLALELSSQQRKTQTFTALLHWPSGLARRDPVLILFEDVHWSDPTSVPNPTGLDGYAMKANSTVWMRFRCGSRRRNERRFCIRQAGPRAAAYSPHATLSAYSFTAEI
ncbi:MAG: hypothetical protein QOG25_603, partial [Acetobacteraceae bacterium]|nr:hypothetical protein [Acetobacteraceae bacterium]